eukprot:TRINITY_DN10342_c0_g1_i1.p1 TRINITY_DN10342_c0_g1~~TRINITY_DN10342_c0_g1_i1.p1  ORF type:complete len:190 (-),score=68.46 TRINITY_DN10342_c0_g1_i1:128-697(-)
MNNVKRVLVPVADGSEDIETVTIVDVMRRAGADVVLASVEKQPMIKAARGIKITADYLLADVLDQQWDLVALPGGMPGAERLAACGDLIKILQRQKNNNKLFAAVCASPAVVFQTHNLLEGKKATCHPSFTEKLTNKEKIEDRVVVDGNCITSRGPGTSLEFSLKLVELLYGREHAEKVAQPILLGVNF